MLAYVEIEPRCDVVDNKRIRECNARQCLFVGIINISKFGILCSYYMKAIQKCLFISWNSCAKKCKTILRTTKLLRGKAISPIFFLICLQKSDNPRNSIFSYFVCVVQIHRSWTVYSQRRQTKNFVWFDNIRHMSFCWWQM